MKFLIAALFSIALTVAAAAESPREITFDGSRMTRSTAPGAARHSTIYRSAADPDFVETLSFHALDASDVFVEMRTVIAGIERDHPGVKLRVLQHEKTEDFLVSFIAFGTDDRSLFSARRLSRTPAGLVAIIYQVDFTLGLIDEDERQKMTEHTAETAVATFDLATARGLAIGAK